VCPKGGGDCNDEVQTINPGMPEVCNLKDDDCDGKVDEDLGTTTCGVGECLHEVPGCKDGKPVFGDN
jgi:hypothetical protein